uniref:Uncharacterized protein n=1 Tax=Amphimedon queenslandica TaxID=400682 RepID=A0A1X7VY54_AMPQE
GQFQSQLHIQSETTWQMPLYTIITSVKKERTHIAKKTSTKVLKSQQKNLELTMCSVLSPNMELLLNATFKMVIAQQEMQC